MRYSKLWLLVSLIIMASMFVSACATATPAATTAPTTAPVATTAPTTAPVATTAPTTAPAATTAAPTTAPAATTAAPAAAGPTFGFLFVGPYNDKGWSEATYVGGQYVESKDAGSKMIYIDLVNPAGHPGTTAAQLGEQLVGQGAKLVIFNSDDMKSDSNDFATAHPDIPVIMLSGDQQWKDGKDYKNFPNMINIMGRMEYMKMVAGCAAALTSQTGKIGYLGPLINDETRRLASSAFLGAKYCWTQVLNKPASSLGFKVTWIGYWFNIPGTTADPTVVADDFFNSGFDVVISGIDTTEALAEANKMSQAGKKVWAVAYDYKDACSQAPNVCLGVPYFNWGPALTKNIQDIQSGKLNPHFEWNGPDWADINNPDTSAVGFNYGPALSADNKTKLEKFVSDMGSGLNLWKGPLNLQDKTVYLKDGEVATDQQIWYLPQLLEGMEGQSVSK